ncbi:hypothetical protein TGPRC2_250670B, partial [Toxoplasma gondii TgCatPRC2]
TEVTPEERVRYSRLYREGVAIRLRRADEMRRQIQSLKKEEQQILMQLRRAPSDGAERGATEGQGSSVGGAVIPDVASGLDDPDGRRTAEQVPFSEPTAPHERGAATVRSVEPAVLLDASLSSMPQPDVGASTCLLTTSMGDAPGYDGPPLFEQVAAAADAPRPTRYGPPAAIELQPSLHLHAPSDSRAALMLTTLVPPSDPYEPASAFLGHFPGASTGSHSQLSWAHQTGQSGHSPASADDNGTPSTIAPQHGTGERARRDSVPRDRGG